MTTETTLPSVTTQGGNGYTFVNRAVKLTNGATYPFIAVFQTAAAGIKVKIVKRNSATNYDVVVDEAISGSSLSVWTLAELTTAFTVPATGDYYAAVYFPSAGTMGILSSQLRSFANSDITGTGQTIAEDSNPCGAVYPISADAVDPNKILTPDGNATLPAAGNVLLGSGTYGNPTAPITPTSDKLYSAAEEAARNVGVAANKILTGNSIKIQNVTTNGSATAEAHTAPEVLTTALVLPGTFNATNLDTEAAWEANVKLNVTGGPAGAWTGQYAGELGDVPAQPTLDLANDATGTSFTGTITGLTSSDYRRIRYRSVGSSTWTTTAASVQGNGTIQITGLTAGGYEAEAFGSNASGVGLTSTRDYITVDDGTASAYPVDTRQADNLARLLLETDETAVLYSRNSASAAFSPEYATSEVETYDSVAGLSISAPRRVSERMVEASRGLYTVRDWYVYISKAELDVYATTPRIMDKLESNSSGVTYDVIAVDVCFNRAGYRLVLREGT